MEKTQTIEHADGFDKFVADFYNNLADRWNAKVLRIAQERPDISEAELRGAVKAEMYAESQERQRMYAEEIARLDAEIENLHRQR